MMTLLWGDEHKRWKAVMYTVAMVLIAYGVGYGPPNEIALALIGLVGAYVGGQSYTDGKLVTEIQHQMK